MLTGLPNICAIVLLYLNLSFPKELKLEFTSVVEWNIQSKIWIELIVCININETIFPPLSLLGIVEKCHEIPQRLWIIHITMLSWVARENFKICFQELFNRLLTQQWKFYYMYVIFSWVYENSMCTCGWSCLFHPWAIYPFSKILISWML